MRMAGMRPEMGPWSRVTVPWVASTATTRPSPSKRDWACPGTAARHRWPQRVVKSSHRRQGCSRDLSIGNHLPSLSPNAGGEPRPRAGARYERRLLGVGSTAWLGAGYVMDSALVKLVSLPCRSGHPRTPVAYASSRHVSSAPYERMPKCRHEFW